MDWTQAAAAAAAGSTRACDSSAAGASGALFQDTKVWCRGVCSQTLLSCIRVTWHL